MITRLVRGVRAPFYAAFLMGVAGGCKCSHPSQGDGGDLGALDNVLGALCGYLSRCPQGSPYPIAYRSQDECVQILQFLQLFECIHTGPETVMRIGDKLSF